MIKKYWKLIAGAIVGIFGLLFIFGKKSNNKKATAAKKKIDTNNVEINKLDGKVEEIKKHSFKINQIEKKPYKRNPYAPFTTSTMQQEGSKKLGFGASRTMQVAQRLYQGFEIEGETVGLITYMRTDGTQISKEALQSCRNYIENKIGKNYLPDVPRNYSGKKAKNAQKPV